MTSGACLMYCEWCYTDRRHCQSATEIIEALSRSEELFPRWTCSNCSYGNRGILQRCASCRTTKIRTMEYNQAKLDSERNSNNNNNN
jgi:hypothetical protein